MRNPATGWFWLSTGELFLLWQAAGLGELPAVLGVPHIGHGEQARAALTAEASATLGERGLGSVRRPDRELAGLLDLLGGRQRRRRTLSLLAHRLDGPFRAVGVVGDADDAVILSVADDQVRIGRVWPGSVADILIATLEPLPAGEGRVTNVPWPVYEQACAAGTAGGADAFLTTLRAAGVRAPEAHTVLRLVTGRSGGGELALHGWDHRDTPLPTPPLRWVDTDGGRYVVRVRDGWLTVTPADQNRLRGMAESALTALADRAC
ncbi:MAG TPA: ESX secretion-associated protein EspG [Pseudonocardiaceae bacterium]|nr:ESX secretion-associated protein EspG [Pseudonocardiaceae bacterium]